MPTNKNITLDDIAINLGVSKTTVSRVISGKGRIGQKTKAKVLAYINESGYRPNIIAKSLAQKKTYNICVVLHNDVNLVDMPFFQHIQLGICEYLSEYDYDVILTTIDNDTREPKALSNLVRIISNHKVDAVLLTRTLNDDQTILYLKKQGVPFVTIGSYPDDDVYQIDEDHFGGSRELVSGLLAQGAHKIALFGGNTSYIVNENRKQGFLSAHLDAGINHLPQLEFDNLQTECEIDKAVVTVISQKADYIVCMDDYICEITLRKLNDHRTMISHEIKVASLFGSTFLAGCFPNITCLDFNTKEMGRLAGQKILDIVNGKEVAKRTLLSYRVRGN